MSGPDRRASRGHEDTAPVDADEHAVAVPEIIELVSVGPVDSSQNVHAAPLCAAPGTVSQLCYHATMRCVATEDVDADP